MVEYMLIKKYIRSYTIHHVLIVENILIKNYMRFCTIHQVQVVDNMLIKVYEVLYHTSGHGS